MLRLKEYLQFDAKLVHRVGSLAAGSLASLLTRTGQYRRGFALLSRLHRGAFSPHTTSHAERFVRSAIKSRDPRLDAIINDAVARVLPSVGTANFFADPARMLGTIALVLKSPSPEKKGVLLLKYNHVFPLFARFFDASEIALRYHLVLEPSWSGFCDLDLLAYARLPAPVFVQAIEPHNVKFLTEACLNLIPVPTAANWWVDHRQMQPLPEAEKEFDVVMMAGWGSYKRHYRFFDVLGRLRRSGNRLRVLLIGYNVGWTKGVILRQSKYYGVRDQIELLDTIPYRDVNAQLNRAKVHLLWSRREGINRATIEAMFAGLPCVLREGFNYGHRYSYINEQTGCFASERDLPRVLVDTISNYDQYSPRAWVMQHMTCQQATARLEQVIAATVGSTVESWSGEVAVKVNELSSMQYFEESARSGFQADYQYLASMIRSRA